MSTRKVKEAKDLETGELIYLKGHAKATYMSDGRNVEDAINSIGGVGEAPDLSDYATKKELATKVDKVDGKQLSTEDFTTLLKQKLDGLSNYDDTEIQETVSKLRTDLDTLVSGDTTTAIKTFNEVIAFLDGLEDTEDLASIIASIEQQIAGKMDKVTLAAVATSGSYNDLKDKPTIPSSVTESTVSGWGFTKNTGTYSKPSGGIPKTDLASAVQTSLGKADTALQSEQYKGTVTSVKINGATKTPDTNGMVDLGTIEGGGGSSSGSGAYPVVITNASGIEAQPNTYYIIEGGASEVDFYFLEPIEGIVNEYIIEFMALNSWSGESCLLHMPDTIVWANGEIPPLTDGKTYVISVVNNLACYAEF